MARRSHIERMNDPELFTKFERTEKGRGLIASPLEYEELMKVIPLGKLITPKELNQALAEKHKADYASARAAARCILLVARAAKEKEQLGSRQLVPYWRTLRDHGALNPRYPGGLGAQIKKLESEGHTIIQKTGKARVAGYRQKIFRL